MNNSCAVPNEDEVQSLTDWAGDTLTFAYNATGQQCSVTTGSVSSSSCTSTPYDTGALTVDDSFDSLGNVADIQATTGTTPTNLLKVSVGTRNEDNEVTSEAPTVGSSVNASDSYGYNSSDQVDSGPISGSSGSDSYGYASAAGITSDTTAFESAGYDQAGVLCWTSSSSSTNSCSSPPSGSTSYATNADGERTSVAPASGNPASYGWDTESNLLDCANVDGTTCSTSSPTSTTTLYTYNGQGLRTSATIGSSTTSFTWNVADSVPQLLSDGVWDYLYLPGSSTPVEQVSASGSSPAADLLVQDESGNSRGLIQLSSGAHQNQLVNYTDYDAYGNPITQSGGSVEAGGMTVSQSGLNSNYVGSTPWGFGGGYTDSTGLVYLLHRYYDPITAQFISVDPDLSNTGQAYDYAADQPVGAVDPLGTSFYWPYLHDWCAKCAYKNGVGGPMSWHLDYTVANNPADGTTLLEIAIPAPAVYITFYNNSGWEEQFTAENIYIGAAAYPKGEGPPSTYSAVVQDESPEVTNLGEPEGLYTNLSVAWNAQKLFNAGNRLKIALPDGLLGNNENESIPGTLFKLGIWAIEDNPDAGLIGGSVGVDIYWRAPQAVNFFWARSDRATSWSNWKSWTSQ